MEPIPLSLFFYKHAAPLELIQDLGLFAACISCKRHLEAGVKHRNEDFYECIIFIKIDDGNFYFRILRLSVKRKTGSKELQLVFAPSGTVFIENAEQISKLTKSSVYGSA